MRRNEFGDLIVDEELSAAELARMFPQYADEDVNDLADYDDEDWELDGCAYDWDEDRDSCESCE